VAIVRAAILWARECCIVFVSGATSLSYHIRSVGRLSPTCFDMAELPGEQDDWNVPCSDDENYGVQGKVGIYFCAAYLLSYLLSFHL
jgi:hypothetical protein